MRIFVDLDWLPGFIVTRVHRSLCSARRCPSFFCFKLIFHYLFVVWLPYLLLDPTLPAIGKGLAVLLGTVLLSWTASSPQIGF